MPWNIIAIPAILCLIWGVKQGLKTKKKSDVFKRD
jgi:hypothetical protein